MAFPARAQGILKQQIGDGDDREGLCQEVFRRRQLPDMETREKKDKDHLKVVDVTIR